MKFITLTECGQGDISIPVCRISYLKTDREWTNIRLDDGRIIVVNEKREDVISRLEKMKCLCQ